MHLLESISKILISGWNVTPSPKFIKDLTIQQISSQYTHFNYYYYSCISRRKIQIYKLNRAFEICASFLPQNILHRLQICNRRINLYIFKRDKEKIKKIIRKIEQIQKLMLHKNIVSLKLILQVTSNLILH